MTLAKAEEISKVIASIQDCNITLKRLLTVQEYNTHAITINGQNSSNYFKQTTITISDELSSIIIAKAIETVDKRLKELQAKLDNL